MNTSLTPSLPKHAGSVALTRSRMTTEEALLDSDAGSVGTKFEEIFLRQLLTEMLPKEGAFFGESSGAQVFKDMFVGEVAARMAEKSPLGIAGVIEKEVDRMKSSSEEVPG